MYKRSKKVQIFSFPPTPHKFSKQFKQFTDEFWAIDYFSVLLEPFEIETQEETVTCMPDGSFTVSIPFTPNADNKDLMVYEQANALDEIDTLYFTDDGTISTMVIGPYPSGRDYNIVFALDGDVSNGYPVIADTTDCMFTAPCNLSAVITKNCVGDSLVATGTISGGTSPYSVYSSVYTTVLFQ